MLYNLLIFFVHFWTVNFSQFGFVHKWNKGEYDTVKTFTTNTYTQCFIACTNEQSCALPGIRETGDGAMTCHLLKEKPKEKQRKGNTNLKRKKREDGFLIKQVICLFS